MIRLILLGHPQILLDDSPIKLARRKSRAILYYLAIEIAPVSREGLQAFFWPDHERSAAQQLLRTAIYGLRKALGDGLQVGAETLAIGDEVEVDARRFQAVVSDGLTGKADLEEALKLYQGDLLADFSLPDSSEFENWAAIEREHFRRLYLRGLGRLAGFYEADEDYGLALETVQRALQLDSLQEDFQRMALRLHYLAGDRAGAIRQYDQLRKLLDEELGVPPMAETRQLYQHIIGDDEASLVIPAARTVPIASVASPAAALAQEIPFTGRLAEINELKAMPASRGLALIEGEPGIGKTRLAQEFLQQFGGLALSAAGRELESNLPYQAMIQALRSLLARADWPGLYLRIRPTLPEIWLGEVGRLLPELVGPRPASPAYATATDESRLWEGINHFLQAIAKLRPLVIFLDDLQWVDGSSLGLLGYLVRQSSEAAISFLAAARPLAPRSPAAVLILSLIREGRLVRLPLTRLTEAEVRWIAAGLAPASQEALAEWLWRQSEGNPYMLVELARDARRQGLLVAGRFETAAMSEAQSVPQSVYALINSRLVRLSEPARRVAEAGVVMGRDFEFEIVARAAALSEGGALDALDELRDAGLIQAAGELRYRFDHNLTLEVAYREMGEPRHRLLHRKVAEAMEKVYGPVQLEAAAGEIAHHFVEGNLPQRATPYAVRAGDQARRLAAWKEAAAFYALALPGTPQDQRAERYTALGEAYFQAGQFSRAIESFQKALALAEEQGDADRSEQVRLLWARTLISQARYDEVIQLVEAITQSGRIERSMQAEMLWGTALSLEGADLEQATVHLERAAALCPPGRELASLAQIKFELGGIAAQQGDLARAIGLYHEALEYANRSETEIGTSYQVLARNNLAYHMLLLGDPEAKRYAQEGLTLSRQKGLLALQPYLLSTSGEIALAEGDLNGAENFFQEGLALAERLQIPERIAGLTANLGLIARERGRQSLAVHRLSVALAEADALGTRHLAAQIRLWLAPLLPPEEAQQRLAEARSIAEDSGRKRLLAEAEELKRQLSGT